MDWRPICSLAPLLLLLPTGGASAQSTSNFESLATNNAGGSTSDALASVPLRASTSNFQTFAVHDGGAIGASGTSNFSVNGGAVAAITHDLTPPVLFAPPDVLGVECVAPSGTAVSLGVHESQSRLWENHVGRSRAFWEWCRPHLAEYFGTATAAFSVDELFGAANVVRPSLIRVEADEATYNLHVIVRFELERALVRGDLASRDLPEAWNAAYRDHLGVDVPDDRRGCLQDVHWSCGLFGYFPTYTLGTLYAHGVDVPNDAVQAFAWYAIAARAGHPEAGTSRDGAWSRLSPAERDTAEALAAELWARYGRR